MQLPILKGALRKLLIIALLGAGGFTATFSHSSSAFGDELFLDGSLQNTASTTCFCPMGYYALAGMVTCNSTTYSVAAISCTTQDISACGYDVASHSLIYTPACRVALGMPAAETAPAAEAPRAETRGPQQSDTPAPRAEVPSEATKKTVGEIEKSGKISKASQKETVLEAAKISQLGANNRANIALISCAAGANSGLTDPEAGAQDLADCQSNFAKADALSELTEKNGQDGALKPDSGVLAESHSQETLEKFEKNFGVGKEEYVNRMLAAHGNPSELRDMVGSKFALDKFDAMLTKAEALPPKEALEKDSGVSIAVAEKTEPKKMDTSLRDSLKKNLVSIKRAPSSLRKADADYGSLPIAEMQSIKQLEPSGLDSYMGETAEDEQELTLFEVVRRKYREFTARQHL